MRAVILANGVPPTANLAHTVVSESDLFLATDGAAFFARALGMTPDIISGDFDSVSIEIATEMFPNAEIIPTLDQDFADTEKAIRLLIERGTTEMTLIGATGGRMDFTFANIALGLRYRDEVRFRCLHDDGKGNVTEIRVIGSEGYRFASNPGDRLSLLTFHEGTVVSVSGVHWGLDKVALPIGTHGVSNVVTENTVTVSAHSGCVLVFREWASQAA